MDADEWAARLQAAIEGFWEGVPEEEVAAIMAALNAEDGGPEKDDPLAWVDELPEDER
jgi:hypothetical protein